jgi:hypothetical protein
MGPRHGLNQGRPVNGQKVSVNDVQAWQRTSRSSLSLCSMATETDHGIDVLHLFYDLAVVRYALITVESVHSDSTHESLVNMIGGSSSSTHHSAAHSRAHFTSKICTFSQRQPHANVCGQWRTRGDRIWLKERSKDHAPHSADRFKRHSPGLHETLSVIESVCVSCIYVCNLCLCIILRTAVRYLRGVPGSCAPSTMPWT